MAILFSDLSSNERAVLANIANTHDDEWRAVTFAGLERLTELPRKAVRAACRSLRDKGLARHERGLISEYDGSFVGSGYTATAQGSHLYWEASADA